MAAMSMYSQGEAGAVVSGIVNLVVSGNAPATMPALATPPPPPQTSSSPGVGGFLINNNSSLYVGDLDPSVDEKKLFELFSQVAEVASVRICRDQTKHFSLCYGYVNFKSERDAANAREVLNFTLINGKPIRIMFSHRDPTIRKTGYANVFIKNLDSSIDNKALHDTFSVFGTILSCKIAADINGKSRGYGFVQYDNEESARDAIRQLNGMLLNDKQVFVGLFVRRQDRNKSPTAEPKFTNIYVKNLPKTTTVEDLKEVFGKYGVITSAIVVTDGSGKSKGFGFINFEKPEDAASALENMNGVSLNGGGDDNSDGGDDKVLYVGKAQRKSEREAELKAKFEREKIARFEKMKGSNLYMKNLEDDMTDEKLKDLFSNFGTITSCKVLVDSQGMSKGAGFVAFSSAEEAKKAMNEMNGKMIGRKPIYVAIAQRKDERRAKLQAYFNQVLVPSMPMSPVPMQQMPIPIPMSMPMAMQMPMPVHSRAPSVGIAGGLMHPRVPQPPNYYHHQFGQAAAASPGLMQPPQGYGYHHHPHQQLLPAGVIRPPAPAAGIPQTGFVMPYHQFQRPPPPAVHRYGGGRGFGNNYSGQGSSRYGGHQSGTIMQLPALASTVASASPENQRMILGEELFPLVEPLVQEHASKITGMLLEMDQNELLHLIESPDALKDKVAEAMEVLRSS